MEIKEQIINMLNKHSLSEKLIYEFFSDSKEVRDAINSLIDNGDIVRHRKELYTPKRLGLKKAKVVAIKDYFSFALIDGEEEDVYIDNRGLNGAFIDDIVYLRENKKSYRKEYEVFSIIKRSRTQVVGELIFDEEWELLVSDVSSMDTYFYINPTSIKLFEGNIALCKITKQVGNDVYLDVIKILGNVNEPGVEISKIIYKNNADIEFPIEVRNQVNEIPQELSEKDYEGYEDFRDRLIVTIDGEDAKDFDDAVEVTRIEEGYEIGVHIADVTHYVTKGSPLDKEALSRGTSIYVTDRVVPMLPFELSNGICSLNPNVDRLVQSCIFKMDYEGNIISSRITHGVMRSKARLTYTYVNKLLTAKNELKERFPEEVDNLIYLLAEVARKLRKKREMRGALDLDSTEIKFICDKDGNPIDVIKRKQGPGEKLIEDLMIAANEIVAETIENMGLPFIYRVHEQPKAKKMDSFMKLSTHLGYKAKFSPLNVKPKELAKHMEGIKDEDVHNVISMMLLRSLAKARYLEENKGHYGLASESYTHFTSPIRRYPDLLVHRLIDKYIIDGDRDYDKNLMEEIAFIADNSSSKERRALVIEREADDYTACKYMSDKIGKQYTGFINGMTKNGFFVELDNGINGYVDFMSIDYDDYNFDEVYMCARGEISGKKFSLGDRVKVAVRYVDLTLYQITFSLINDKKTNKINSKKKKVVSKKNGKRKGNHNKS